MPRRDSNRGNDSQNTPSYLAIAGYIVDFPTNVRHDRIVKRSKRKNRKAWFCGRRG